MGRGELIGLAALLSVVIEILKKYGVIPDGLAGLAAFLANAIVYIVAGLAGLYGWDMTSLDALFMMLAELLGMVLVSFLTHKVGRAMELPLFKKGA